MSPLRGPHAHPGKPDEIQADLDRICDLAKSLGESYRWSYPMGYERAVRGREEGGGGGRNEGAAGVYHQRRTVRSRLEQASRKIEAARVELAAAMAQLNDIAADVDRTDHLPGEHDRAIPRTVTKAELAGAHAAKRRRTDRGEGYGVS